MLTMNPIITDVFEKKSRQLKSKMEAEKKRCAENFAKQKADFKRRTEGSAKTAASHLVHRAEGKLVK